MRAVVITRHGGPEVLRVEERPDPPAPATGEVRIAVRAAGINFADTMARAGTYPDAPPPPCVVGYEVAGEIESVGEGVDRSPGDRVLAGTRFGGHAELVTVADGQVLSLPDSFDFAQGAAFPVNYATAHAALVTMGGLKPGERVLIHAAAGGVGTAATQIAKRIGAEVFGTASASKHEAIREQGVDHPIDYRNLDFADEAMRITGGVGLDLIMDAIGPSSFRKDYAILRSGGRLIMYGASELQPGETRDLRAVLRGVARMPLATMPWWKSLQLMSENRGVFGLNMLKWWDDEGLDRVLEPLGEGLARGDFEPVVAASFNFDRAVDAHRLIAERGNVGKVVLTP